MQDLRGWIVWGDGHFEGAEESVKVLFPKSEMFLELNFVEVSRVFSWQGSVVGHAWYVREGSSACHMQQQHQGQLFFRGR